MARPDYDVIIMGGGPAGSSLAARLRRESSLRVAVFEERVFPREHIGESFASPIVPCLQETGALPKVLASNCYVLKFGGYYAWGAEDPTISFFRHRLWQRDGIHRWSMHVNRAEFDHVLLKHAKECGGSVFEGVRIEGLFNEGDHTRVRLSDGFEAECRIFVDASGRTNATAAQGPKGWLSSYRNIAIWGHFTGGLAAQSIEGEWNLFREGNLSPIGCFAFADGWCWYIPVRQAVNGRRVVTHSIGIVTDPKAVKRPGSKLLHMEGFIEVVRRIPFLGKLVAKIQPIHRELHTATNYSMISGHICDFDRRRLSLGDASFFVDPLFSSGVSFALLQAASASKVIQATLGAALSIEMQRELWRDYEETWSVAARSFAMNIDQWYAAIAHENPNSVYWNERASNQAYYDRRNSFDWLLDTDFSGDLVFVISRGGNDLSSLNRKGPLMQELSRIASSDPPPNSRFRLNQGVSVKKSMTLGSCVSSGVPSGNAPNPWAHGVYWKHPDLHAPDVAPMFSQPMECYRFIMNGTDTQVRFFDPACLTLATDLARQPRSFEQLRAESTPAQWNTLTRLLLAGMAQAEASATDPKDLEHLVPTGS